MSAAKRLRSGAPYKGAPLTLLGEGILCGQCKNESVGAQKADYINCFAIGAHICAVQCANNAVFCRVKIKRMRRRGSARGGAFYIAARNALAKTLMMVYNFIILTGGTLPRANKNGAPRCPRR